MPSLHFGIPMPCLHYRSSLCRYASAVLEGYYAPPQHSTSYDAYDADDWVKNPAARQGQIEE